MTEHSHHHAHGHGGKEGCCSGGKKPDAAEHAIRSGDAEEQRRKVAELMEVFARAER